MQTFEYVQGRPFREPIVYSLEAFRKSYINTKCAAPIAMPAAVRTQLII